jgi:hypothetical protein
MARGYLEPPNLDDRTWREIVEQARALIPRYAPEWTDHNPSDLGMTLIELFAWLTEGMIYRLNHVPEKNYIAFLNLLGITRDPPAPATTLLTYRLAGDTAPVLVPQRTQAATAQTEQTEAILFETDADLRVLPTNLEAVLLLEPDGHTSNDLMTTLAKTAPAGTSLELPPGATRVLGLGFDQPIAELLQIHVRLTQPAPIVEDGLPTLTLQAHYSQGTQSFADWPAVASFEDGTGVPRRAGIATWHTDPLRRNGVLRIEPGSGWATQSAKDLSAREPSVDAALLKRPLAWIGLHITNTSPEPIVIGLAYLLFNSVEATSALTIREPELLGISDGQPFQSFELKQRPLYRRSGTIHPYDHLAVQVRRPSPGGGFGAWEDWTLVDDVPFGPGTFFRADPVAGTVLLGNHDPGQSPEGHGSIPPAGSEIRASRYRYVSSGATANVAAGTVTVPRSTIPGVGAITNTIAATGGTAEEDPAETRRRAPALLRNRYRAVTAEDYEYLVREASRQVSKIRCLPPRLFTTDETPRRENVGKPWNFGGLDRQIGNINIIIVPQAPPEVERPEPTEELLALVMDYLERRRPLTTRLRVVGPRYLPIKVNVDLRVWKRALDTRLISSVRQLETEIRARIRQYLHPLHGGSDGTGWKIGQDVLISNLFDYIRPDTEIGFISSLTVQAVQPAYEPRERPFARTSAGVWVQVADYELVCSNQGPDDHQINASEQ